MVQYYVAITPYAPQSSTILEKVHVPIWHAWWCELPICRDLKRNPLRYRSAYGHLTNRDSDIVFNYNYFSNYWYSLSPTYKKRCMLNSSVESNEIPSAIYSPCLVYY